MDEQTKHYQAKLDYEIDGSTKGALNMHRLGFRVKEMMGGMEWWLRDGLETHGTESATPNPSCNC